jgi:small-conductance mechanosensitive channel
MHNQQLDDQQSEEQPEVRRALKPFIAQRESKENEVAIKSKSALIFYILLAILFGVAYLAFEFQIIHFNHISAISLQRYILGGLLSIMLLLGEKLTRIYLISRVEDDASRYNVKRLIRFFIALLLIFVLLSTLLTNWTTGLVSIGILSVIVGLALQAPLANLFAWFYILIQTPYRIGDRIKINDCGGDVIEVGYFETTLWEFGGEYLSSDHPSGRRIKFPNSLVLNTPVFNYSWSLFPYIWDEIKFYVAYESDLEFISETLKEVAREKIGDQMRQQISIYRELLANTPVDELDVNEEPIVFFRLNENTWIEVIIRYLVQPKQMGRVKTELIREMLQRLKRQPDRVKFPTGYNR